MHIVLSGLEAFVDFLLLIIDIFPLVLFGNEIALLQVKICRKLKVWITVGQNCRLKVTSTVPHRLIIDLYISFSFNLFLKHDTDKVRQKQQSTNWRTNRLPENTELKTKIKITWFQKIRVIIR